MATDLSGDICRAFRGQGFRVAFHEMRCRRRLFRHSLVHRRAAVAYAADLPRRLILVKVSPVCRAFLSRGGVECFSGQKWAIS